VAIPRALEVIERINTEASKGVLNRWAGGTTGHPLTEAAAASIRRANQK
jgi:hypothetical protein